MLNNQQADMLKTRDLDALKENESNFILQIIAFLISSEFITLLLVWPTITILQLYLPSLLSETKKELPIFAWLSYELIMRSLSLTGAIVASLLCINRFTTSRSTHSLGYLPHKGFLKDYFIGCLISFVMISIIALIQWLIGGTEFFWAFSKTNISIIDIVVLFSMLFVAATYEEVIFRGYPLQTLAHHLSPTLATIIMSGLFGLVHIGNPSATFFSTANTVLAGIWLSIAYFKTRSLWLAIGLHLGWNLSMGAIYGLPVSGILKLTEYSLLDTHHLGKTWLTGGSYGPEGGAIATLVLILGTILLIKLPILKISPEMEKIFTNNQQKNLLKD